MMLTALSWALTIATIGSVVLFAVARSQNDRRGFFENQDSFLNGIRIMLGFFGTLGAGFLGSIFATLGLMRAESHTARYPTRLVVPLVINIVAIMGCFLALIP